MIFSLPKKASLISVLSVRRMIFTTKMTARGVRNEMAYERDIKRHHLLLHLLSISPMESIISS